MADMCTCTEESVAMVDELVLNY